MGKDIIEKIKAGYLLPSLSDVALRFVQIASNENCSMTEMAALIEENPGLTVHPVSIADGALSRATESLSTVQQSVMRVGSNLRVQIIVEESGDSKARCQA